MISALCSIEPRRRGMSARRLLFPRKQTLWGDSRMTAKGHKRTSAKETLPSGFNAVRLAGLLRPGTSAGKFPKTPGMQASTIFRQAEGYQYDASLPAAEASL
jgi:hypothetical protein